ncbi:MAG: hypothetical protein AB8H79_17145 [Myxococcota bacterium]
MHAHQTSDRLRKLGVPHAVCGGVAVGVLGYPRATRDVAFLLGRQAEDPSNSHGFSAEVMALYNKDVIHLVLVRRTEPEQGLLLHALQRQTPVATTIPVVGPLELVWLKLSTPDYRREHDDNDIRQLLRVGAIDAAEVLDWLELHDPYKAQDFAELVQDATQRP